MSQPFNPLLDEMEIVLIFKGIDNVEIIKSEGEGTVLKATDKKLNKTIAIKIYSPNHVLNLTF